MATRRNRLLLLGASMVLAGSIAASDAKAETVLWDGWMNITDCSRKKTYKDDFGIEWPTMEFATQELHGKVTLAKTLEEVIVNRLKSCALKGVAAAGLTSLLTSPASAWPVFVTAYKTCLTSDGLVQFIGDNLTFEQYTTCRW